MISYGILAALASVLFAALTQLIGKTVVPRIGGMRSTILIIAAGIIPIAVLFLISPATIGGNVIVLSVFSGIFFAFGFILYYRSVESQRISNTVATSLIQPAILALYAIVILSQPINSIELVGTVAIFAGVGFVLRYSMQCQGGAKNHVIVLPDADMELATQIISDSAFGCAGQRCLAVSVAITVGEAQKTFRDEIANAASAIRVGNGLDAGVQMGPVITGESKHRIESLIATGVGEGAKPIVDGRNTKIPSHEAGNFLKPTILDGLPSSSQLAHTEIFGPVLSLIHANSIDEAMDFLRRSPYGNQASLFTTSGAAARRFRYEAPAGNIGINIGVAAPMAYFPFSGWKESFFGILHGQGRDAVEFYTESKVVIERWSRQETRKF